MADLILAVLHHLLILSLAGLLSVERVLVRPGLSGSSLRILVKMDAAYGATAGLILVVGFCRVYWGAKGAAFYLENPLFWAKIAAFAVVGLLSILPTIIILRWGKQAKADPAFAPSDADIAKVRRALGWELVVFALIPIFAAAMARGYGL
jgi:putative membrane protein